MELRRLLLLPCMVSALTTTTRNIAKLKDWALRQGVEFHPALSFVQYGYDSSNWGLALDRPVSEQTVILRIPRDLSWNANTIRRDIDQELLRDALAALEANNFSKFTDEFLLFKKLLTDFEDGKSRYKTWFDNLPCSYTSGLTFSSLEKGCLPVFARAMAEQELVKYRVFCAAACVPETDHTQRLYSTVYSRCWSVNDSTELVPIGDMFNHGCQANVLVVPTESSIEFVYKGGNKTDLRLNYGNPSNPHRFLIVFGFVDSHMEEVWSHLVFPYPDEHHRALGCDDTAFRVDGAVSNAVFDSTLYAVLRFCPELQTILYEAHVNNDRKTKAQLHNTFAQPVRQVLMNHVDGKLAELDALRIKIDGYDPTTNLKLIRCHNKQLSTVFSKVKARLTDSS